VASSKEVPKDKLSECLKEVCAKKAQAPVAFGQVLIRDICGTGADIIATRAMQAVG
jgi:CxxC motif-containing protein